MKLKAFAYNTEFDQLTLQDNKGVRAITNNADEVLVPVIGSYAEAVAEALNRAFAKNDGMLPAGEVNHLGEDLKDENPDAFPWTKERNDIIDNFDSHYPTLVNSGVTTQSHQPIDNYLTDVGQEVVNRALQQRESIVISVHKDVMPKDIGEKIKEYLYLGRLVTLIVIMDDNNHPDDIEFDDSDLRDLLEEESHRVTVYASYIYR